MMLVYKHKINDYTIIPSVIIVCREILVSGLREFLIATNVSLPVSKAGKIKTFLQMLAVVALIMDDYEITQYIGAICLWVAAIITVFIGNLDFGFSLKMEHSTSPYEPSGSIVVRGIS